MSLGLFLGMRYYHSDPRHNPNTLRTCIAFPQKHFNCQIAPFSFEDASLPTHALRAQIHQLLFRCFELCTKRGRQEVRQKCKEEHTVDEHPQDIHLQKGASTLSTPTVRSSATQSGTSGNVQLSKQYHTNLEVLNPPG